MKSMRSEEEEKEKSISMEKISTSFELYGKEYRLETGELAKQATGAVLVTQGETTCLVTAVVSKEQKDYDFFPLTVDFIEKMYAVGRIPGGYLKREAKPSDKGTLTARMIDRPIRPGFADGFKQEVHVVATTLACDGQNPPDCICVGGASAALLCGGTPFDGPAACVRIARDKETGEFIVNPTYAEQENSDLELTIAGTRDYISMVEAGADEVTEEDMLAAMEFGQQAIAAFCEKQAEFLALVAPEPKEYPIHEADPSIAERVNAHFDEMSAALKDADKLSRMGKVEELKAAIKENDFSEEERDAWKSDIAAACKALEKHAMRAMVIETGERADGRAAAEIRPLTSVRGICLACTAPACSSAARRRRFRCAPWVCSMRRSVSTRSTRRNPSAICISTTSRRIARAKRAAWALRSAAKSATAPWPSAPSCRSCLPKTSSPTPSAWCPKILESERLVFHGVYVRLHLGPDGCGRADQGSRVRHRHGP